MYGKAQIIPAVLHLHTTVFSLGGSGQLEDDIVKRSSLGDLPVNACGAMIKDEGKVRARNEVAYTTLGGTLVVSNTKFLMARKLNPRSTNEGNDTYYPLTSCSGSHTTERPNH